MHGFTFTQKQKMKMYTERIFLLVARFYDHVAIATRE